MEVGIPVEVEGRFGEYYSGVISGLVSLNELIVNIVDCSRNVVATVTLPPTSLRLPCEISEFPLMNGKEVDVLLPYSTLENKNENGQSGENLPQLPAWWSGKIKRSAGAFVIVELEADPSKSDINGVQSTEISVLPNGLLYVPLSSGIDKSDVVEKHQLRPRSFESNLSTANLFTHTIDIPDILVPYCRDPANCLHFAKRCGLPALVCMAPESFQPKTSKECSNETYNLRARLLVISTERSTINRAAVLDNTFIDMLRQKVLILQETEALSQRLEAARVINTAPYSAEVCVPEKLLPYAIGFHCCKIEQANAIEGIMSVKLDRASRTFRILAKTEEALEKAKSMFDYSTDVFHVPHAYARFIVDPKQRHIQHIVDRVGLSGLKISDVGDVVDLPGYVTFRLTGTRRAIHDARMFLEFHIASLQELDKLRGVEAPPGIHSAKDGAENNQTEAVVSSGDPAILSAEAPARRPARPSQHGKRRPRPQNGMVEQHSTTTDGSDTTNTTEAEEENSRFHASNRGTTGGGGGGPGRWPRGPKSTTWHNGNSRGPLRYPKQINNNSTVSGHETSDSVQSVRDTFRFEGHARQPGRNPRRRTQKDRTAPVANGPLNSNHSVGQSAVSDAITS